MQLQVCWKYLIRFWHKRLTWKIDFVFRVNGFGLKMRFSSISHDFFLSISGEWNKILGNFPTLWNSVKNFYHPRNTIERGEVDGMRRNGFA